MNSSSGAPGLGLAGLIAALIAALIAGCFADVRVHVGPAPDLCGAPTLVLRSWRFTPGMYTRDLRLGHTGHLFFEERGQVHVHGTVREERLALELRFLRAQTAYLDRLAEGPLSCSEQIGVSYECRLVPGLDCTVTLYAGGEPVSRTGPRGVVRFFGGRGGSVNGTDADLYRLARGWDLERLVSQAGTLRGRWRRLCRRFAEADRPRRFAYLIGMARVEPHLELRRCEFRSSIPLDYSMEVRWRGRSLGRSRRMGESVTRDGVAVHFPGEERIDGDLDEAVCVVVSPTGWNVSFSIEPEIVPERGMTVDQSFTRYATTLKISWLEHGEHGEHRRRLHGTQGAPGYWPETCLVGFLALGLLYLTCGRGWERRWHRLRTRR